MKPVEDKQSIDLFYGKLDILFSFIENIFALSMNYYRNYIYLYCIKEVVVLITQNPCSYRYELSIYLDIRGKPIEEDRKTTFYLLKAFDTEKKENTTTEYYFTGKAAIKNLGNLIDGKVAVRDEDDYAYYSNNFNMKKIYPFLAARVIVYSLPVKKEEVIDDTANNMLSLLNSDTSISSRYFMQKNK